MAKDQLFYSSPRNIVRGVYTGDGLKLCVKRGSDFGTYVDYQLNRGSEELLHFYLDMHYPFSTSECNKPTEFKGVIRTTHNLQEVGAFMWSGHGYTDIENEYVEAAEHVIESMFYHVSSESCMQVLRGEWARCQDNHECGQKMWLLNIKQFSVGEQNKLGEEITKANFTLVRFNTGEQRILIQHGEETLGWVARTGELGSAGSLDKTKLARTGHIFSKNVERAGLKMEKIQEKSYVGKVFQGSEVECGNLVWSEREEETGERRGPLSCILQLLHQNSDFNLRLLTEVCRDQTGAEQGSFVAELYRVLSGASASCDALLGADEGESLLSEADFVGGLPELTNYINMFLSALDLALKECEVESIRKFVIKEFTIKTRYKAHAACPCCRVIPPPTNSEDDLPKIVLKKTTNRNAAVDVKECILSGVASQTSSIECKEERRCRRAGLPGVPATPTVVHWPHTLHVSLDKPSSIKLTDITNPIELEPNVTYQVTGIIHQEGQKWWNSVKVGENFYRVTPHDGVGMAVKEYPDKQETRQRMNIRGKVVMLAMRRTNQAENVDLHERLAAQDVDKDSWLKKTQVLALPKLRNGKLKICALNTAFILFIASYPQVGYIIVNSGKPMEETPLCQVTMDVISSMGQPTDLKSMKQVLHKKYPSESFYEESNVTMGVAAEVFQHLIEAFVSELKDDTQNDFQSLTMSGEVKFTSISLSTREGDIVLPNVEGAGIDIQFNLDKWQECQGDQMSMTHLPEQFMVDFVDCKQTIARVTGDVHLATTAYKIVSVTHYNNDHYWTSIRSLTDGEEEWWKIEDYAGDESVWRQQYRKVRGKRVLQDRRGRTTFSLGENVLCLIYRRRATEEDTQLSVPETGEAGENQEAVGSVRETELEAGGSARASQQDAGASMRASQQDAGAIVRARRGRTRGSDGAGDQGDPQVSGGMGGVGCYIIRFLRLVAGGMGRNHRRGAGAGTRTIKLTQSLNQA